MTSRHIPTEISNLVTSRHFFECAWCGEKLTERHHITEFAKGGEHTTENLILLCPNCHTQVHKGEIKTEELVQRKSTHLRGDRLSGGTQFEVREQNIKIGSALFKNVPTLLMFKENPLIYFKESNGEYFLSTRFYNKEGELIFWMSSNRYWSQSDFVITSKKVELIIVNEQDANNKLRIWQDDQFLNIEGKNYVNGLIIDFAPSHILVGTTKIFTFNATDCMVGINIV